MPSTTRYAVPNRSCRAAGLCLGMDHEGRAFVGPDIGVQGGRARGSAGEHKEIENGIPPERVEVDDARIGEKLAQIGPQGAGGGRLRRAELGDEDADFGGASGHKRAFAGGCAATYF